jgi:F0F1-type ATP synthase membrane subunit a
LKLFVILIAVVAVLGWLAIGLLIAQGPKPEIVLPAEVITTVGPLNISNTLITAWLSMAVLIVLSLLATRSMKLMPSGLQNFVEASIGFLIDQIEEIGGRENGRRFFTVVATIFLFIIVSNWMGLLPIFNAIGKTEDVGHEIYHVIAEHNEEGHAFEEAEHFAAWVMEDGGAIVYTKPRGDDFEFEIHSGEQPAEALDRYIVALAEQFTGFEAEDPEEPSRETVVAAAAALAAEPSAPKLLPIHIAGDEGEAHGVESPALGETITGIEFPEQKLALVIPYLRGAFSDVNNTLAIAIVAFCMIEFWGFQSLGIGYLGKFFNFKKPIDAFVGILELLSEFIRIISFAFRLFGNIFAGEVLILMLTFLMPFLFVDIIYGLEIFVGFIQATVFALLTLVFGVMAVEHHGEDAHQGGHHDKDAQADPHHHPGTAQSPEASV